MLSSPVRLRHSAYHSELRGVWTKYSAEPPRRRTELRERLGCAGRPEVNSAELRPVRDREVKRIYDRLQLIIASNDFAPFAEEQ